MVYDGKACIHTRCGPTARISHIMAKFRLVKIYERCNTQSCINKVFLTLESDWFYPGSSI